MCAACDEFGGINCPVCCKKPKKEREFHCEWCGRDFTAEDNEEVKYKSGYYCRECYEYEKENDEALMLIA